MQRVIIRLSPQSMATSASKRKAASAAAAAAEDTPPIQAESEAANSLIGQLVFPGDLIPLAPGSMTRVGACVDPFHCHSRSLRGSSAARRAVPLPLFIVVPLILQGWGCNKIARLACERLNVEN